VRVTKGQRQIAGEGESGAREAAGQSAASAARSGNTAEQQADDAVEQEDSEREAGGKGGGRGSRRAHRRGGSRSVSTTAREANASTARGAPSRESVCVCGLLELPGKAITPHPSGSGRKGTTIQLDAAAAGDMGCVTYMMVI